MRQTSSIFFTAVQKIGYRVFVDCCTMHMMKMIIPILITACAAPVVCDVSSRSVPVHPPHVESFSIGFNDETIRGFCLLIDARTPEEKTRDMARGSPAGPVIVFFHGHAQRPDVAYEFTSKLALLSRSGMVVIPVCDTPYGINPSRHGDSGKDVILMEMVRFVLAREGIAISGYSPICDTSVTINGVRLAAEKDISGTRLVLVGWSHGGILARRFAHAYPGAVGWLGQVCPAGYEHWGAWKLTGRFAGESARISINIFKGQAAETLRSGWGFTKGFMGDFLRSIPSAAMCLDVGKMRRVGKDIKDCTLYCDSSQFSAAHLERIVVIFGRDDTCMDPQQQLGIKDPDSVWQDDLNRFKETFFADVPVRERITLRILKGTHLAPVIHNDLYAKTLLADLGQIQEH